MNVPSIIIPSFDAVASNSTCRARIPRGVKVYKVQLVFGDSAGTTVASGNLIGDIRTYIGERLQRETSAIQLNLENSKRGVSYAMKTTGTPGTAGYRSYLTIHFFEPWLNDTDMADLLAWNMRDDTLRIEVDFKNVTTPVVSGRYWAVNADQSRGIGIVTKWFRKSVGASGTNQNFEMPAGDNYHSLTLYPPTGAFVSKARLKIGSYTAFDLAPTLDNQAELLELGLNPDVTANPAFIMQLDAMDPIKGALPTVGAANLDLYVEYSAAASGNMVIISQRTGVPA